MEWFAPISGGTSYQIASEQLQEALSEPFSAALARQNSGSPVSQRVSNNYVPDRFEYVPNPNLANPVCQSVVTMTVPTIERNFAFIETSLVCGDTCGAGTILAFQKTTSGWKVIALTETWVS
jgi:hypothetical protein